jgi:hypothetical protein
MPPGASTMRQAFLIFNLSISCLSSCKYKEDNAKSVDTSDSVHNQVVDTVASFEHGKSIFTKYCNGCHYRPDSKVIADPPIFDDLFEKMPSPADDYFVKFVQNSKALKQSGDEYSNKLDKMFSQAYEHNFKDSLSQGDFKDLIVYFKIGAELRSR